MRTEYQLKRLKECKESYEAWIQEEESLRYNLMPWFKQILESRIGINGKLGTGISSRIRYPTFKNIYESAKISRRIWNEEYNQQSKYFKIKKEIEILKKRGI